MCFLHTKFSKKNSHITTLLNAFCFYSNSYIYKKNKNKHKTKQNKQNKAKQTNKIKTITINVSSKDHCVLFVDILGVIYIKSNLLMFPQIKSNKFYLKSKYL